MFPLTAFVLIDYIRQLRLHKVGAQLTNAHRSEVAFAKNQQLVTLLDEQGTPQLEVRADALLFICAAMNYVEAFYLLGGKVERVILRNTLKAVVDLLPRPPFERVHRSYVVNLEPGLPLILGHRFVL